MLTLWAPQVESLWDESLPLEVKELPADLAELDRVLGDPELMMVLLERWRQEVVETRGAPLPGALTGAESADGLATGVSQPGLGQAA